jgi:hypothetical protein
MKGPYMFARFRSGRPGRAGALEAKSLGRELEQCIEDATRARMTDMARAFERLEPGWQERLQNDATFVLEAAAMRHAIRDARNYGVTPQPMPLRLQASTLFIRDSHVQLTSDPEGHERLHLVSGTVSEDGVRVLSRIVQVDTDQASAAYVRADARSTHNKIVELVERDGHQLMGMWHSHIMHGAQSTRPSGVDLANQQRFVDIGWDEVIGGIFSLDGYVRLFSTAHDFSLSLYGNGADIVSDGPRQKILKLTARES